MHCLNCGKEFIEKKNLKNLFKDEEYCICSRCLERNPFKIEESIIPLERNRRLRILSLFPKTRRIVPKAFQNEYDHIAEVIAKDGEILLKYESFILSRKTISELEEKYSQNDILILCYYFL